MRRLAVLVALVSATILIAPAAVAHAAGTWTVARTGPADRDYQCVDFIDSLWGWTAIWAYDTTMDRTTDGGTTWTTTAPTPAPSTGTVEDIAMAGSYTGIAVGTYLWRTIDRGATWTNVTANLPPVLALQGQYWAVDYPDPMRAYIGGDSAFGNAVAILTTVDAGTTWVDRSPTSLPKMDMRFGGLDFVDAAHGWALVQTTNDLKVLATSDMGRTWSVTSLGVHASAGDISFLDASHGWVLAEDASNILVFRTTDGGATWQSATMPATGYTLSIRFTSPAVGFMALSPYPNETTLLARTTDAGATWSPVYARASDYEDSGLNDLDFTDPDHGWAAGRIGGNAALLKYTSADSWTTPAAATTVVSGVVDGGWYNGDVTALLESSCSFGSLWVRYIDWSTTLPTYGQITGAYGTVPIAAPASDGLVALAYQSTDDFWTVELDKMVTIGFDRVKPTTKGLAAASARRGRAATLRYEVLDASPCGPLAKTVTVKVKNRAGKVVKTLKFTDKTVNAALSAKFTVPRTWKTGTYKYFVYATDNAGNAQSKVGSNRLTVR